MPLLSLTQSSLVSMILASMWLSTSRGGTAIPVPASTARASVIFFRSLKAGVLPRRDAGHHAALGGQVGHGQVSALDEAVEARRPPGVETRGGRGVVGPDLDRRVFRRGRHLEVDLRGTPVEHIDGAAVRAAA